MPTQLPHADLIAELRHLIEKGEVVPIVGAGVSAATVGAPGWYTLLRNGLNYLDTRGLISASERMNLEKLINENCLTQAASAIQKFMNAPGGEYPAWLTKEFDFKSRPVIDSVLISEILDLPCPLVATTNYDHLLQRFDANLRRTTVYNRAASMANAIRSGGIFHFHGSFDDPSSVILSSEDYESLLQATPYRQAIQTLWLTKSLLFIGCSFDGISDPDFSELFNWAHNNFGASPHRHYALVLNKLVNSENNRKFLLGKSRIQLIPTGDRYDQLAQFIADINPDRTGARLRRANRINEMLSSDAAIDDIDRYLNTFGPWVNSEKLKEIENLSLDTLITRESYTKENRTKLNLIKAVCNSTVKRYNIAKLHKRWRDVNSYSSDVHDTCLEAYLVVSMIPLSFLREVNKRENVGIPGSVIAGHSQGHFIRLCSAASPQDRERMMKGDSYGFELIERIVRTFLMFDEIDVEKTFPLPLIGVRQQIRETCLAVGSHYGVEIVDYKNFSRLSYLTTDTRVRSLIEFEFNGNSALLILTNDRLIIWDPRRAPAPLVDIALDMRETATEIITRTKKDSKAIFISSAEGEIFSFQKEIMIERENLEKRLSSFTEISGDLFACDSYGSVYFIELDWSIECVIDRSHLIDAINEFGQEFYKDHPPTILDSDISIQHTDLTCSLIDGKETLVIHTRFGFTQSQTAVFLWRKEEGFIGSWFFIGRIARIVAFSDAAGPCIVVSLLAHWKEDEALMLWARVDDKPGGHMKFATSYRSAFIIEDIFCLAQPINGTIYAVDLQGRSYSAREHEDTKLISNLLNRDSYSLCILRW